MFSRCFSTPGYVASSAPITTGTTLAFTFHILCSSILIFQDFFSVSLSLMLASEGTATARMVRLSRTTMSDLVAGMTRSVLISKSGPEYLNFFCFGHSLWVMEPCLFSSLYAIFMAIIMVLLVTAATAL
jgi:hypothetical protein